MTPIIKIKVFPKPVIKGKMDVHFPANVAGEDFITVTRANQTYTFGVDYSILTAGPITDPTTAYVAVEDRSSGLYRTVTLASLLASATQIEQHITAAGPVAINNNTGIVRVNQAVGAPISLTMPLASAKTCPVLISDWKADAGTNAITINLSGADKFPGNLTSWTIAADTGSVFLRPIPGVGYAL
ncbi:hypothetical protein [Bradyrhizobium sp.]|uniref:hypothetical protein n=1 Tax=Bradyrhizobium sp. TaxID=376 RepID=UPI0025BE29CD|nr:hypothetical protein [Bradyrhizobium sp.]